MRDNKSLPPLRIPRVEADPADQQPCGGGPPVRAVTADSDLRGVHPDSVVPVILGDTIQQPPQRGDPPGADREINVLIAGGPGQRPGEISGIRAQRDPPALARGRGQGS